MVLLIVGHSSYAQDRIVYLDLDNVINNSKTKLILSKLAKSKKITIKI